MTPGSPTERRAVAVVHLGEHLRTWRTLRHLTMLQVAEQAGVSRGTVSKVERGDGSVRLDAFLSVAQAVGCLECIVMALDPTESPLGRVRAEQGSTAVVAD